MPISQPKITIAMRFLTDYFVNRQLYCSSDIVFRAEIGNGDRQINHVIIIPNYGRIECWI